MNLELSRSGNGVRNGYPLYFPQWVYAFAIGDIVQIILPIALRCCWGPPYAVNLKFLSFLAASSFRNFKFKTALKS